MQRHKNIDKAGMRREQVMCVFFASCVASIMVNYEVFCG